MQFTKEELYLISGACLVVATQLTIQKTGDAQKFQDLADKASRLISEAEKAERPAL